MHLKTIIILIGLSYSIITSAQDTILIKGYVIGKDKTLPETSVVNTRNNTQTLTNDKGIFKIKCAMGDTLIFKNKLSNYSQEEYIVKDNFLVVIALVEQIEFNEYGDRMIYGYVEQLKTKHSFQLSTSIIDNNLFSLGYSYSPEKLIVKNLFLGVKLSQWQNNESIFPNVGYVFNIYKGMRFNNHLYLPLLSPNLSVGYYAVNSHPHDNGFGYELELGLINYYIHNFVFRISGSYNSYLSTDGTLMINLNISKLYKMNRIPNFISKKLPK